VRAGLPGWRRRAYRLLPEQIGEECPVAHDGQAQLLRAGLAMDVVGIPVVVQRPGVLDRELGDALPVVPGG
jgi:hypothetical protein